MRSLISIARKIRVWLLALTLFFSTAANAQVKIRKVCIPQDVLAIQVVFDSIESATGLHPHWPDGMLDPKKLVHGIGKSLPYDQVLAHYLGEAGLSWDTSGTTIFIKEGELAKYAAYRTGNVLQPVIIRVQDETGASLSYASLKCRSTGEALCAGPDGWARIWTAAIRDTFDCTYAGMLPEVGVARPGDTLRITMKAPCALDGAVVTTYVNITAALYTGNIGTVTRKQIADQPVSNILSALVGRVTGVQVTQSNGNTGSSYDIVLRSGMSIGSGHDPLVIIDNIPFSPGVRSVSNINTGTAGGSHDPLSFIDKDDVETIQFLKDADATAIYGTRGANGVVIITTRKTVGGKPRLTASISTGVSAPTRLPHLMNTQDYLSMRWETLKNDGSKPNASNAPDLVKWDTTRYTNWQHYFFPGPGHITRAHSDLTGGSPKYQYFIGGNMVRETNVFEGHPAHELYSVSSRLDYHSLRDRLRIGLAALAGWDGNTLPVTDVSRLTFLVPFAPPLVGKDGKLVFGENDYSYANPISFTGDRYHAGSHNYLLSVDARYRIWDSLSIKLTAGGNNIRTREFSTYPGWNQDPALNPVRSSTLADARYNSWILEPRLEYKWLPGQWNIKVFAGMSRQGQRTTVDGWSASGFPDDSSLPFPAMAKSVTPAHRVADYQYSAYFGQMTFHWKEKYMLNLSWRRDGSSRFSGGKRFGNFNAAGAGWILSKEAFFHRILPVCSFAKIRGSYGVTGNDGIGSGESYVNNWSPTVSQNFQRTTDINSTGKLSSDASWERVKKMELSLELGVLQNRVLFTATWYRWRTDHQILPRSAPDSTGNVYLYETPAVLQATGWEFNVTSINIRNKNVSWTTNLGISLPTNKLVAYPGIAQSLFSDLVVGASLSSVNAVPYKRVDPKTGVFSFQDGTTIANHDIRCLAGLENTLSWHNWELSALVEARFQTGISSDAAVYAVNRPGTLASGMYSNQLSDINQHWREPGDNARYQVLTAKYTNEAGRAIGKYLGSTAILVNADYLRLKSICLSRRLPKLFKTAAGRIFVQGANLWTLTRYRNGDPEIQSILTVAPLKSFHMGVELRF
jgi:TonB-linked SusC/RagA family outer membrane protein